MPEKIAESISDSDYCVYIHTCLSNGKVYVGQTKQSPFKRWASGEGYKENREFYSDIEKYGWNGFSHDVLVSGLTAGQADVLEIQEIRTRKSMDPEFGYNHTSGGSGHRCDRQLLQEDSAVSDIQKCGETEKFLSFLLDRQERLTECWIDLYKKQTDITGSYMDMVESLEKEIFAFKKRRRKWFTVLMPKLPRNTAFWKRS